MGIDEVKEYKDYPFVKDDTDNVYNEGARKTFDLLHARDNEK